MEKFDRKEHWENIYKTKLSNEVSWYQPTPDTSLDFISQFNLPKQAKILDIGGGDSFLADYLLDLGYQDITVLDISEAALQRAKLRLGDRAQKVKWTVADVTAFKPPEKYDLWHDRATFHFLTEEMEISDYLNAAQKGLKPAGILIIGTFSEQGPKKCSGIEIKQYSETTMTEKLKQLFKKIKCITINHRTPFDTIQNFVFCSFRKIKTTGA
jgi:ubiquinone/menaquinone biosynthesis C-methylase UbiE